MIDKTSYKIMKAMMKKDLPEESVAKILKTTDIRNLNNQIYHLKKSGMISVRRTSGVPDGEGGFLEGTANPLYHLEPNGRVEVENVRKSRLKWLIATGIALAAAIGAILSALLR